MCIKGEYFLNVIVNRILLLCTTEFFRRFNKYVGNRNKKWYGECCVGLNASLSFVYGCYKYYFSLLLFTNQWVLI